MSNTIDDKQIITQLNSPDSNVFRENAIQFMDKEMSPEIVEVITNRLTENDMGVRDIVSNILIQSNNKLIYKHLIPLVSSKEISVRNLAGEILLKKGNASVDDMLRYIPIGDDDDKKFIIDILGLIGELRSENDIIKVLNETKNENVILACLESLGNIKSYKGVDKIIELYGQNELFDPTIIEALGKIGGDEASSFLTQKYTEMDELSKFSLVESLGEIGREDSYFMLLGELKNTEGPLTWACIEAIDKLKDKLQIDIPFDDHVKNAILSTLVDGESSHKIAASKLIGDFQDKDITSSIVEIYGLDENIDNNVKDNILRSPDLFYSKFINYIEKPVKNLKQLIDVFTELIQTDGGESLWAISELEMQNLGEVLAKNLEHPDEEIRRSCIELLFYVNMETALLFLDTMINDDNYWNRIRLLEILEQIDDESVIESIKKLAEDSEEMVKERAIEVLNSKGIKDIELRVE